MSPNRPTEVSVQDPPNRADQPSVETVVAVLSELVRLKELKDRDGETADYRRNKDAAWEAARGVLGLGLDRN